MSSHSTSTICCSVSTLAERREDVESPVSAEVSVTATSSHSTYSPCSREIFFSRAGADCQPPGRESRLACSACPRISCSKRRKALLAWLRSLYTDHITRQIGITMKIMNSANRNVPIDQKRNNGDKTNGEKILSEPL